MDREAVINNAKSTASEISQKEEHRPMVIMVKGEHLQAVSLAGVEEKESLYPAMALMLRIIKPDFYIFVIEAYMAAANPDDISPGVPIRDTPGRAEVLLVQVTDRDGSTEMHTREITPGAGIRFLGPWRSAEGEVNLVPTKW